MTKLEQLKEGFNGPSLECFEAIKEIVAKEKPKTVLEIGSGWGVTASAFLLDTDIKLTTVDSQPILDEFDMRMSIVSPGDRLERVTEDALTWMRKEDRHWDLVYVDGCHDYEGLYFDLCEAWKLARFVVVCDDIFHKNNFIGERTYGTTKALLDFVSYKGRSVDYIVNKANGYAVLRKREK